MNRCRSKIAILIFAVVLASGCTVPHSFYEYFYNRTEDLSEVAFVEASFPSLGFHVHISQVFGWGTYASLKDPGEPYCFRIGLGGIYREFTSPSGHELSFIVPILRNLNGAGHVYQRWIPGYKDTWHAPGSFGLRMAAGIGGGIEFDILEAVDFIAGLFMLDPARDDTPFPWSKGELDEDGRKIGRWTTYYGSGGKESEGDYSADGEKTGPWTYWHENGQQEKIGNYVKGQKHGQWKFFYPNGRVRTIGRYMGGRKIGKWREKSQWTDEVFIEGEFENDVMVGQWESRDIDGEEFLPDEAKQAFSPCCILSPLGHRKNCLWTHYYRNKNVRFRGAYTDDKRDGEWEFFGYDKKPERTEVYVKGRSLGADTQAGAGTGK